MIQLENPIYVVFSKKIPPELKPKFVKWIRESLAALNLSTTLSVNENLVNAIEESERKNLRGKKNKLSDTDNLTWELINLRVKILDKKKIYPFIIYVTQTDLCFKTADFWIFGGTRPVNCVTFSINRFVAKIPDKSDREIAMKYMFQHELGHLFETLLREGPNIVDFFGQHCSTKGCTMQQVRSTKDAVKVGKEIRKELYCKYCKRTSERSLKK